MCECNIELLRLEGGRDDDNEMLVVRHFGSRTQPTVLPPLTDRDCIIGGGGRLHVLGCLDTHHAELSGGWDS